MVYEARAPIALPSKPSSGYFSKSILNEKDLDKYRNPNNNVFYQSFNGLTEIMSDGERIINIFKTADSLNG